MGLAITVVALIIVTVGVASISLQQKLDSYAAQKSDLEEQIAEEEQRSEDLETQSTYVQTDQYVEDTAREKLGMAKDNEIIFKNEDAEQ